MKRVFDRCPRCDAPLKATPSFAGPPSRFWRECTKCNTFVNTYIPQEHQEAVHRDNHTFIGNFGAYGTGKTLTSIEEIQKHCLITDNANVLVGANVISQYEQTIKRDLEADLPAAFVADSSAQKAYIDLKNGARIIYRPFDDPDKLRSYNLSMFVIIEASEVKAEAFHQLKTRLRNLAASVPKLDKDGRQVFETDDRGVEYPVIEAEWTKGIIESNPDSGWIRTDMLLNADEIVKHGRVADNYTVLEANRDPAIGVHVASTDVNRFLPPNFIANLTKNKPAWWVSRYVWSSFSYSEGLVYPSAMKYVTEVFEIPKEWPRIVAHDYGLSDDAVFLFGAIDEVNELLYIYKEIRVNNRSVEDLAKIFKKESADIPIGGWICAPIIDPKSGPKRDYNKDSLMNLYAEQGIVFQAGYVNIEARILRTNTYFEAGRIRIMKSCEGLIVELRDYKFKPKSLSNTVGNDAPEDKNNHAINPLEWICMELPANPKNILNRVYNRFGLEADTEQHKDDWMPYALRDDTSPWNNDPDTMFGMEPIWRKL